MIGTLLTLFFVGLVALVGVGIVLSIVGALFSITFGIAGFLLFKVAPIVLVGWLVLKLIDKAGSGRGSLSAADRRWLDQS
ncbi:MAG: hypothetical protein ACLFWG_11310 [Longimicrobiales bacterium]